MYKPNWEIQTLLNDFTINDLIWHGDREHRWNGRQNYSFIIESMGKYPKVREAV